MRMWSRRCSLTGPLLEEEARRGVGCVRMCMVVRCVDLVEVAEWGGESVCMVGCVCGGGSGGDGDGDGDW